VRRSRRTLEPATSNALLGLPEVIECRSGVRLIELDGGGPKWGPASALAIPAFAVAYFLVARRYPVSHWFALAYVVLSAVCLMAYAFDKSAARAGRWRSSEQSLLALGLLGGWPGGLIAQQLLRHKSSKASFREAFWGTVVLNVAAFMGYHVLLKPSLYG